MRKLFVMLTLAVALLVGSTGPAAAQSERACVGAFASELARDEAYHPLGGIVRHEARDLHPYGQTILKPLATQCILEE